QRLVQVARYAVIYPIDGRRPRLVLLPCTDDWDQACGCPVHTEDLDVRCWFGGKPSVDRVRRFPGTQCYLTNGFDILFSRQPEESEPHDANRALQESFAIDWHGSLLVVKQGRRNCGHAVHITSPEIGLVGTLVQRYV
ncbi:hypothetical protein FKP32DRAFT_1531941, partial [Trametes sanguinea]